MENNQVDELWKRYKRMGSEKDRELLVRQYMPLVKYLTDRIITHLPPEVRSNDKEDLYVEGIIGLIEAIDKFEPERNIKFETYASKRVRGSIIDTLRREDLMPKNVREQVKRIELAYAGLEAELGRPATDEEVCKDLRMTKEEFYVILDKMKGISLISLESEILNSDGETYYFEDIIGEIDSTLEKLDRREVVAQLAGIIEKLERDERILLEMYYWDGLTLKEIGLAMGISESRVCQIHTKLILKLRSGFRKLEQER
jgi:RNA polymerase sigma factor for flagellar operon FliA